MPDPTASPIDRKKDMWWANLNRARNHARQIGRIPTQRERNAAGEPTGKWIAKQKEKFDALDDTRREAFLTLIDQRLDARESHFDDMVAALATYHATYHRWPSSKHATLNDIPVGQWVHDLQRGRTVLDDDRRAKLEAIGYL